MDCNDRAGQLFSNNYKHLIIHRDNPNAAYVDVYLTKDSKFQKVASHTQWSVEYVSDTLEDVNGDGMKDFLINWYGSNGCCLKNFYDVYLYQPTNGAFSRQFEFINPTFSPKEKKIRGVKYGHPGETEMYTYKWNGTKIDTIEYIYYEKNETGIKYGKVIRASFDEQKRLEKLNTVPKEYKKIYGYDWFTGDVQL